jgi:hypothetical protein
VSKGGGTPDTAGACKCQGSADIARSSHHTISWNELVVKQQQRHMHGSRSLVFQPSELLQRLGGALYHGGGSRSTILYVTSKENNTVDVAPA